MLVEGILWMRQEFDFNTCTVCLSLKFCTHAITDDDAYPSSKAPRHIRYNQLYHVSIAALNFSFAKSNYETPFRFLCSSLIWWHAKLSNTSAISPDATCIFGAATRTKNPDDEDQLLAKPRPASEKVLEVEAVGEANRMMGVRFF